MLRAGWVSITCRPPPQTTSSSVVTIRPYARTSLMITAEAARRAIPIVALTDSAMSPVVSHAIQAIVVGVESPSFFHSMVPAFAAIEALAAVTATALGDRATAALRERERLFEALDVMVELRPSAKNGRFHPKGPTR